MLSVMEKIKKDKKVFAVLTALSAIVALGLLIPSIICLNFDLFYAMIPCLILSSVGFYCTVFFGFSLYDMRHFIRLLGVIDSVCSADSDEIAYLMGWKKTATEKFIKKAKKRGYIV